MIFTYRFPLILAALAFTAFAQNNPAPGPAPGGGGAGSRPGGGNTPSPNIPGRPGTQRPEDIFNRPPTSMDRQMPIFLSGKVVVDDGTPPPEPATIERVCNGGTPRPEGYTNTKGHFSFQLGNNMGVLPDASVGNSADTSDITGRGPGMSMPGMANQRGFSERDLMGCEIRASLPGYRSQTIPLSGRRFLDNPDIGTIVLKRLGHVEGLTTSITTLQAPKDAKKAYEKGLNMVKKNKDADAEKELQKAVDLYPQYAIAWYELGAVHERAQRKEDARKAYAKSLESDSKFVKPYMNLAGMAAAEQKWEEVDTTTDRVIKLNPFDFPGAYFYNAVANLNMQNLDAAEKSARDGLKQDDLHRLPKLEHVLGVILAQKNDLTGAAEHMKAYLKFAPNAKDADMVRNQLSQVEKASTTGASAPPEKP